MNRIFDRRQPRPPSLLFASRSRFLATLPVLLLALVALLHHCGAAVAEPRTALVIGNATYSYAALANPVNDATDVAAVLRDAGFEVIFKKDADEQAMDDAIREFANTLKTKGGVGLFYFSGHGIQAAGENYLLPIGEAPGRESDLKLKAVNAGEVIDDMAAADNSLNIVILDACRNNPLPPASHIATRGLSRVEGSVGTFISFSTSPGGVALDGDGRNSPYTKHLVEAIRTRSLNLEGVFKETLKGVYQETDGKQVPWISSSFFGDFAFYPGVANGAGGNSGRVTPPRPQVSAATPRAPVEPAHPPELAGIYHASGTNPNGSRYFGMTSIVASGADYDVTWWIGKQLFHGSGHLAGRMLVVEWGDAHPVIYPIDSTDTLAGEWADGTATETLERFAAASSNPSTSLAGSYRAAGRNPNGSRYDGTVAIREEGSAYRLSWQIGKSAYQGVGRLSGNILVVDWGSSTPVVYAVGDDGVLKGLWEAGRGEETLSPVR